MESRKVILIKLFAGQQWKHRYKEHTWLSRGWEEWEVGMYRESNMEIYITICKIDSQRAFALWLRELKLGLCKNLEGCNGNEDGKEVQEGGDICIPMADSCWCLAQTNTIL